MTKSTSPNRYSGIDSTPWVVMGPSGQAVPDAFTGYKEAAHAAQQYRDATGLHAAPVRK
jgi:hypothetical protein